MRERERERQFCELERKLVLSFTPSQFRRNRKGKGSLFDLRFSVMFLDCKDSGFFKATVAILAINDKVDCSEKNQTSGKKEQN